MLQTMEGINLTQALQYIIEDNNIGYLKIGNASQKLHLMINQNMEKYFQILTLMHLLNFYYQNVTDRLPQYRGRPILVQPRQILPKFLFYLVNN